MKRFLILLSLFFCNVVRADTINLHWLNEDGSTYQNSTCVMGGDLILPSTPPTKQGYTFTGWKILTYTYLEYIEATGTQYIDTGVKFTNNVGRVDIEYLQTTNQQSSRLFGFWAINSPSLALRLENEKYYLWAGITELFTDRSIVSSINTKHTVSNNFDNGTATIIFDGQTYTGNYTGTIASTTTSSLLFAMNYNTAYGMLQGRIYSAQIYDGTTLVRNFIPAKRHIDNAIGMYDTISKTFFTNAGTGDFIAGPELLQ